MVRLNRAPLLLFTVPEAAGIGMTEPEAKRQGDILVGRYPFYANVDKEGVVLYAA